MMINFFQVVVSVITIIVASASVADELYRIEVPSLTDDGVHIKMGDYRAAKVILIVNTASNDGYAHRQINELKELHQRHNNDGKGLQILAFPCNQFGSREPGSHEDIQVLIRYNSIKFPVFGKINVNGPNAHIVYKWLKKETDNLELPWNFAKFLLVDGIPVKRYHPRVNPLDIEEDILEYLQSGRVEL
jgi:glutathione peroxidase